MAILVTGGAGFIGSHTVVELTNAGYEVLVLDNFSNSKPASLARVEEITGKPVNFVAGDIRDRDLLDELFGEFTIEAVIHFAALKAVAESVAEPLAYYNNNIGGTITLLEAMRDAGCKKIVFSSSATVYGGENPSPLREDMPIGEATNPYGTTKIYMERILQDLCISDDAWSVSLLRYFNPIGAHESGLIGEDPSGVPKNLLPYVTQVAVGKREKLTVNGNDYPTADGTCVRDYIHVVDLALGHVKALQKTLDSTGCGIYNLGTGIGYSVLDIVKAFEAATGMAVPYEIGARRPNNADAAVSYSDPSKALAELGWKAERNLEKMCEDAWRWQKNNPNGFAD